MSDEAALLQAIIAHADEDTPRLVYADWLDEHGDPDRAEFIRVQCRLADLPPNDPDWVDLTERQDELTARMKHRFSEIAPADGFHFSFFIRDEDKEPFRRGFPHFISCRMPLPTEAADEVAHIGANLTRLVRTTTFRGIAATVSLDTLTALLAAPVTELDGLELLSRATPADWRTESPHFFRLVGISPALRRVRQLILGGPDHPIHAGELARATALDSVRRLTLHNIAGPKAALEQLTRAAWFRRLHHFRSRLDAAAVAVPMVTGLGRLPELHTLVLPGLEASAVPALAAGKFPALARLSFGAKLGHASVAALAASRFPALTALTAAGGMRTGVAMKLFNADWFGRLRVLDLDRNAIEDKGVRALAAHPVAKALRVLKIGDNSFGNDGLTVLAEPDTFPALTTLGLRSHNYKKATSAELAAFLSALRLPHLRHLDMSGWPLGDAGAEALARNPAFAGLTRLDLDRCGIGDPGAAAIFASPHLQNLVELQMSFNPFKSAADALADPAVMPRLGEFWLIGSNISGATGELFNRKGLYLIT